MAEEIRVEVWGPNLGTKGAAMHVHANGCADTQRRRIYTQAGPEACWRMNAGSLKDIVLDVYDPGSFEYEEENWSDYAGEFEVFPCVHFPSESTSTTEAKEATMPVATDPKTDRPARNRKSAAKPAPKVGRQAASVTTSRQPVAKETTKPSAQQRKLEKENPKQYKKATPTTRSRIEAPAGFKAWTDTKLAARVLKEKKAGKTIKEIAAGLRLPADERHWHKVSLVYRAAAGADRPTARKAK